MKFFSKAIRNINRFLDFVFHSDYNPFNLSGTLASAMLAVLVITGIYLLFFFSVSDPYSSLNEIQNQFWLGKWIRALHRYATGAAIFAAVYHFIQITAQQKYWGPRALAWISGFVLVGALLVSAWTGYVMIWDRHGQMLAYAGVEIVKHLPFLAVTVEHMMSGEQPISGSFIFMNLFLHCAIPLVMFFGIWIHTSKLRASKWFPGAKIIIPVLVVFMVVSVLIPAPMTGSANLLRLLGEIETDLFSYVWLLPVKWSAGPWILIAILVFLFVLIAVPFWVKHEAEPEKKPSQVNPDACSGCRQCFQDCPFEAIVMVPSPNAKNKKVSFVEVDQCVSCGICAGSCTNMAIGPPGRKGSNQKEDLKNKLDNLGGKVGETCLIFYCIHQPGAENFLINLKKTTESILLFPMDCTGNINAIATADAVSRVKKTATWSCGPGACVTRLGADLTMERLTGLRGPFLPKNKLQKKIQWFEGASQKDLQDWVSWTKIKSPGPIKTLSTKIKQYVGLGLFAFFIAAFSAVKAGSEGNEGSFRVILKIPSEQILIKTAWKKEELKGIPAHMRPPEKIKKIYKSYKASIHINGKKMLNRSLSAGKLKKEGILRLNQDFYLNPGFYQINISIYSEQDSARTIYHKKTEIKKGQVELFVFDHKKL